MIHFAGCPPQTTLHLGSTRTCRIARRSGSAMDLSLLSLQAVHDRATSFTCDANPHEPIQHFKTFASRRCFEKAGTSHQVRVDLRPGARCLDSHFDYKQEAVVLYNDNAADPKSSRIVVPVSSLRITRALHVNEWQRLCFESCVAKAYVSDKIR